MYRRVVAVSAVLVALMLTAFAPAPFPRREARGDSLTLKDLIGDYRAVSLVQTGTAQGNGPPPPSRGVTHVSITSTQWVFNKNSGPTTYDLRVDNAKKPVEMN